MSLRRRVSEFDALLLTAGIWFLAKFLRYAFPPLFPTFREGFRVSNAVLGGAFTAMMLVYAALQFPGGALADLIGPARVLSAGAFVTAVGALVLAVEVPFAVLVLAMVLVGAGTGVHKTVSVRLLSGIYAERTGRVLGVFDTFGTAGGILAPAAVLLVARVADWHAVFLAGGVLGLLLALGTYLRITGTADGTPETDDDFDPGRYLELFATPSIAAFVGVTVLYSFTYNGAIAFLPLYLTDAAGISETVAGLLYSLVFAVSLIQPLAGDLGDRFGHLRILGSAVAVATLGLGLLVVVRGTLALGVAVALFGIGSHGYRPVRAAHLMRVLPDSAAGGGLGAIRTILMGAGAISPAVVGAVSSLAGFGLAFGLLAGALVFATAGVGVVAVLSA